MATARVNVSLDNFVVSIGDDASAETYVVEALTKQYADSTPKTGDGIHPKWFLVIGLVALSLIMFMRKDNLPQARTA